MNVDDSVYAVAHAYPGGVEALAVRMGKSAAVLRSKVSPQVQTHVTTLREAIDMTVFSGDVRVFKAAALEFGHMLLPLPGADDDAASDMAVLELVAAVWSGQGDLGSTIHHALADGVVTKLELDKLRTVAVAAQTRISELVRRFEGLAE